MENNILIRVNADINDAVKKLEAVGKEVNKVTYNVKEVTKATEQSTKSWGKMTGGVLSVMFAGMALQRVFGGLLKTQMDLYGVNDMLNAMWTDVLAPVMSLLVPILYNFMEFFMNLPDGVKMGIGIFVVFAAVLGTLLAIFGSVGLGVMGFTALFGAGSAFAGIGGIIMALLPIIGTIAIVFVGIGFIVKGVIDLINGKLQGLGLVIAGVGVILLLFVGWWALIPIAVGVAVYLIIKHWDSVKAFFIAVWEKIKEVFWSIIDWIKSKFESFASFVMGIPGRIWDSFKNLGSWIYNSLMNIIPKWMIDLITGGINLVGSGIKGVGKIFGFAEGGVVPGPKGAPQLAMVHGGETITPPGRGDSSGTGVGINVTYNINVQDRYELERMMRDNNSKLAEEVKRLISA
jgi:hypothetical protein